MTADWQRQEARKAADEKIKDAVRLMHEAKDIYSNIDFDVSALSVGEAIEYAAEVVA